MKNKKGFTLVEIIVCLGLIVSISAIAFISINISEKKQYDEKIVLASMTYSENENNDKRCIKLTDVLNKGYLLEEYISYEDKNKYIIISSNMEGYKEYEIVDSCTERLKILLNDEDKTISTVYYDTNDNKWYSNSTINEDGKLNKVKVPTKIGYSFEGFYIDKEELNNKIINKDGGIDSSKIINEDTILYAKWSRVYTITLDNQIASKSGTEKLYFKSDGKWYEEPECETEVNNINIPEKDSYLFGGYYTLEDGQGEQIIDSKGIVGKNKIINEDTTLYAKWSLVYIATLDNQGALNIGTNQIYFNNWNKWYNEAELLTVMDKIVLPNKTGYTFGGYYSQTNGTGNRLINEKGERILGQFLSASSTLYAEWNENIYIINLDNQGATTTGTSAIYLKYNNNWYSNSGCTNSISIIAKPTKTGYIFKGYYTSPNGRGTKVIDEYGNIVANKTLFTANSALYAYWDNGIYTINLDNQGATTTGTSAIYLKYNNNWYSNSGCTNSISIIAKPTKTGYIFKGYYTSSNGRGTKVIDEYGNIVVNKTLFTANSTIYAYWVEKTYIMEFGGNRVEIPVGKQTKVISKNSFKVYGNDYRTTSSSTNSTIYKNGNDANSLTLSISAKIKYSGYASGTKEDCKLFYKMTHEITTELIDFSKVTSCINYRGSSYTKSFSGTFNFNQDGEIIFEHNLGFYEAKGSGNIISMNEMDITIDSEN